MEWDADTGQNGHTAPDNAARLGGIMVILIFLFGASALYPSMLSQSGAPRYAGSSHFKHSLAYTSKQTESLCVQT